MPGENAARPRRCAVVGAGVLGACVAARLAEAGIGVTLLERAQPGHAATRSSFAWLNANDKAPRAYHDLNHAGMRAWAGLSASRVARGLQDADVAGYRVCVRPMPVDGQSIVGWLPGAGGLYVAVTHSGVTLAAHLAKLITTELVSGAPAAELAPYRPHRFAATTPALGHS